jgi:quercetin dioxygenase-like cupin family protein
VQGLVVGAGRQGYPLESDAFKNKGDGDMLEARRTSPRYRLLAAAVIGAVALGSPTFANEEHAMLTFTHLYSDADGVSHFKTEQMDFKPLPGAGASQSLTMHVLEGAQGATLLRLRQGAMEDWHIAPRTQFLIAVQGESEVTTGDGKTLRVKPGDVVLMDDTKGKGHKTAAVGPQDHVALVVPVTAAASPAR